MNTDPVVLVQIHLAKPLIDLSELLDDFVIIELLHGAALSHWYAM